MKRIIGSFLRRNEGAVTVEWVVLAAAVLGLAMVVLVPVALSTSSATVGVANYVREAEIGAAGN